MKAILVVDVPMTEDNKHICNYCPIWNDKEYDCQYIHRMLTNKCPLRPMPDRAMELILDGLDKMEKIKNVKVSYVNDLMGETE